MLDHVNFKFLAEKYNLAYKIDKKPNNRFQITMSYGTSEKPVTIIDVYVVDSKFKLDFTMNYADTGLFLYKALKLQRDLYKLQKEVQNKLF